MKPSYSGGACRIPLVGRQDFLRAVERRICWGGVHLLYVEAQGGMGKTALLEAMLERNRPDRETDLRFEWCVAREVIDFRHTDLHSPEGLIRRIIQVTGEWCFGETLRALQALDQTRNGNGGRAPGKSEGALEAAFLSEYSALAERGVVLAFDTVEELTWACSRGDVQAGSSSPILSAGEWLLHTVFPALQGNAVILLAGRPSSIGQLLQGVREQNPLVEIQHIPLTAYTADETREYLRTVTQVEASCGNPNAAARLMAFCQAQGDTAHFLTGGKPLLLALVTELVARGWNLPAPFGRSLDELRQRGAEEWWPETEQALAVQLLDSPNRMGDILRALAWLPKGATPELLARVMELKTSDGQWDVYAAAEYLDQVAELRLVQVRAEDRRVFLHDELQALLERHIHHERGQEDREKVCTAIRTYYRNRAHDLERRLERLPPMSSLVKRRLGQVWVEEMYYCLRHCPSTGAAMYFWLAEEALSRRDSEMDLLLHAELMRTIRWMKARNSLEGLCPGEVEMEVGLRLGLRKLFLEGDAEGALEHLDRLQSGWGENTAPMALEGVHLHLCQARARIQRAQAEDWDTARGLLQGVEQAADEMLRLLPDTPLREGHRWQVQMLKALALQGEGRLAARQGRYLAAVQHYQAAAMLERRLEMSGLTHTLVELAHAMAHTGQVHHARLLAQEAERRGRRSGDAEALTLAFNARATVEEYDNHPRDALGYACRALQAARPIHDERIQGAVHLTYARVRRRLWSSLAEHESSQGSNLLLEALQEADLAVNLLWQYPADKLNALLERACIHREIARWHDGRDR